MCQTHDEPQEPEASRRLGDAVATLVLCANALVEAAEHEPLDEAQRERLRGIVTQLKQRLET
jgi:hypothetical protein